MAFRDNVEKAMLTDLRLLHGKPPFANAPHRMGR